MLSLRLLARALIVHYARGGAPLNRDRGILFGRVRDHQHLLLQLGREVHAVDVRVLSGTAARVRRI